MYISVRNIKKIFFYYYYHNTNSVESEIFLNLDFLFIYELKNIFIKLSHTFGPLLYIGV